MSARSTSPKVRTRRRRYRTPARTFATGSNGSEDRRRERRASSSIVVIRSCMSPIAPADETALESKPDSTWTTASTSSGSSAAAAASSRTARATRVRAAVGTPRARRAISA
ncbi:MAG TPA: hypothetical protein VFL83_03745 [Anaeromyxobacter sp.]|nr:hypothetical protein [Anaeromyxobacter sp.]